MKIDIYVNLTHDWKPYEYDFGKLNGSEEMVVLFSRKLQEAGHEVTVYSMWYGSDNGIKYRYRSNYGLHSVNNILISFKDPEILNISDAKLKFLWTADPTVLTPNQRENCSMMFGISKWHKHELERLNPGFSKIFYIEPGFDPINISHKTCKNSCLYASSPDRGLDYLLEIWPKILQSHSNARLFVTYIKSSRQQKGVEFLGRLSNHEMAELYTSSDLLLYPCNGGERFCLTALKAQYYGCIPCVIPTMALQNTIQFGIKSLKDDYLQDTINLMGDETLKKSIRREMSSGLKFYSWEKTVNYWLNIINNELLRINGNYSSCSF